MDQLGGKARVIISLLVSLFFVSSVISQDRDHKGGKSHPHVKQLEDQPKSIKVLSFQRFERQIHYVCDEMQVDGRREKFFNVAVVQGKEEEKCVSCRALWRSMASACKRKDKDAPIPKKKKTGSSSNHEAVPEEVATPLATSTPEISQRYPSAATLDLTSRLADSMYEFDQNLGSLLDTIKDVHKNFMDKGELTIAERDYFEIFFTYLESAWEGREDKKKAAKPIPEGDVDQLFE